MEQASERRAHPRAEVFPLWEERQLQRVWLFHPDEPDVQFGLLVNVGPHGGCIVLHKDDSLPANFRLDLLDPANQNILSLDVCAEEQWQRPYFAGFKKVGFRCGQAEGWADRLDALMRRLDKGDLEYVRCRVAAQAGTA